MGGASSGMPHFSAAKRRRRTAWWGRGGVVASRYILGTSRRLSLPRSMTRGRAHGRGILRHAPLFSREAALAHGVVGMRRRGCHGIQSWDKPEVVPPKVVGAGSCSWEGRPPACPTFQPRSGVGARRGGDAAAWLPRVSFLGQAGGCPSQSYMRSSWISPWWGQSSLFSQWPWRTGLLRT